jgi:Fe-S cluster assembly ATP-binding protein
MGHPSLEVTEGQILFGGQDITEADTDERARLGLFMAFQYPVAIPGVTITKYLRMVMNAHREARGEPEIPLKEFRKTVEAGHAAHERPARVLLPLPQRRVLRRREEAPGDPPARPPEAETAILDETDSGLDIDALNVVANGVNTVARESGMGVLIITHYQRILHLVQPERVSILFEGRIVHEGGPELVTRLEAEGYAWVERQVAGTSA